MHSNRQSLAFSMDFAELLLASSASFASRLLPSFLPSSLSLGVSVGIETFVAGSSPADLGITVVVSIPTLEANSKDLVLVFVLVPVLALADFNELTEFASGPSFSAHFALESAAST